ncbi:hypothetical protein WK57_11230 [Burkholderia ubonensis]|uniref:Uncharacterized protein n=1 Tax=Burkholderia ubonensis TaxID=101571 RepID=A0AA40UZI9_9BURK|nr:hypothetical protein [Burkholderia ubonensis]KVD43398.1 hypothetical protein WI85_28260 [Burkholderia ubonensis]KWZ61075.1 hypothetical protein WK57_11230 [Burkholderia ubonensis]
MSKRTNPKTLDAAEFTEMLEAARRAPNMAAALRDAANVMEAVAGFTRRAGEIRLAAQRLETNPWDADAAKVIEVRLDEMRRAARMAAACQDMSNHPDAIPAPVYEPRNRTFVDGREIHNDPRTNVGIVASPSEVMGGF